MTLDRRALKQRAKDTIRDSRPSVISVGAAFLLLSILLGLLSNQLVGMSGRDIANVSSYISSGNYQAASDYMVQLRAATSAPAQFIDLLITVVESIVNAGFIIFLLNTIRSAQPCFGNLLDGFGFIWKIVVLNFLIALFITLWSLLLIFPGFIAAYRYSQAIYILVDDPTKAPMQCLRESKQLMRGHKWELFKLNLSFFGWYILASLPTFGYAVQVWSLPYTSMTYALYYEQLIDRNTYEEPVYTY